MNNIPYHISTSYSLYALINLENLETVRQNIKYYRKKNGYTQESLAILIGIKRSLLAAYEEGRAAPRSVYLAKMAQIYGIKEQDFGQNIHKLDSPSRPVKKNVGISLKSQPEMQLQKNPISKPIITTNSEKLNFYTNQQIEIVGLNEYHNYLQKHHLPHYLEGLPRMSLPFLASGTSYRGFEIENNALKNIALGQFVVCKFVRNWYKFDSSKVYIVVNQSVSIVCGIIENRLQDNESINFKNEYLETELVADQILEVWEVCLVIGVPNPVSKVSLDKLTDISNSLSQEIIRLSKDLG